MKLFHKGSQFDMNDMRKYTFKKGVEFLHIRKEDVHEFIEKYQKELDKYVADSRHLEIADVAGLNESIYETVQELGSSIGFSKEVQTMAKTHVRMTLKSMGKSPTLATVLKQLDRFKGRYIAAHSSLSGYIACAIASHMHWGSEATFHKLSLASFLHDIALGSNELSMATSIAEVKDNAKFDVSEKKTFSDHPIKGAEIARQFTEVPPDVDVIIFQHHERPDGSGFPRGLSHTYMAPLACVFLVAHDIAHHALVNDNFNMKAFSSGLKDKYTSSQFRKILSAVDEVSL